MDCFFEPDNQHSDSAIIVKKGDNTVGHIPEGLCQSLTQLHKEGSIVHITSEITPLQKGLLFKAEDWKFPVFTI